MHSQKKNGVLAHPVERNTGSVEVSSSSLLYSTPQKLNELSINKYLARFFVFLRPFLPVLYQFNIFLLPNLNMEKNDVNTSKSCYFYLLNNERKTSQIVFFCVVNGLQFKRSLKIKVETRCWDFASQQAKVKKSYNPRTRDNNLKVNMVIEDFKSAFSDFCVYVDMENPKPEKLFSTLSEFLNMMEKKENKKIEKKGKNQLDLITRIKRYV